MARPRLTPLPIPVTVFVGGMVGGGLRLGLDALIPATGAGIPLDIVAINIVGALLLGILSAWVARHGQRPWVPMIGTGALGSFTTFSALAVLPWVTNASAVVAVAVVVGTLLASIGAAALGWRLGESPARSGLRSPR